MDRAFILDRIPEIAWIQDETLRNQCLDTWLYAANFAHVGDKDLDQITFASVANIREQNIKDDDSLVATLEGKGMEVNEVDKNSFIEVLNPLYDKWEKKVIGTTPMDAYREYAGY